MFCPMLVNERQNGDSAALGEVGAAAVTASGLRKAFGEVVALADLTLTVRYGSVVGLLGPNGSGKTTAVSILSTGLTADGGSATVCGLDVVRSAGRVRAQIGFAGQFAAVDENLTGRENLELVGRLSRLNRPTARARTAQLLDEFDLGDAASRLVRTYSGGMRRRLDVAAALVHQPRVLFLDEPTTGLDVESRRALWDRIRQLVANGTSLLLTTQYLEEADALADEIVMLRAGRVVQTGTPAALKAAVGAVLITLGFSDERSAGAAESALTAAGQSVERTGVCVRTSSREGSAAVVGLLRALDGRAPDPSSVAIREPTLDDVFLALTGTPGVSSSEAAR
jgi:ABC-2 type transport system ATP-binding protein